MKVLTSVFLKSLLIVFLGFIVSCKYDETIRIAPDPGIPVSFSEDVIPIFNAGCNVAGCHNGSGPAPDLRAQNAYDALWSGGYIDTMLPDQSELYLWMVGVRGLPMPVQGSNATYNSTILGWIDQGALNN